MSSATHTDGSTGGDGAGRSAPPARRMTRQRAAVSEALRAGESFVSAQQLHAHLRERGERAGLATVYRLLQAMADDGELDVRRTEAGEMTFRRCGSGHHHHVVCRGCGRTEEVASGSLETLVADLAQGAGFASQTHSLEITGLCQECAAAGSSDRERARRDGAG